VERRTGFRNVAYIEVTRFDTAEESKWEGSMIASSIVCKAIGNRDSSKISCGWRKLDYWCLELRGRRLVLSQNVLEDSL